MVIFSLPAVFGLLFLLLTLLLLLAWLLREYRAVDTERMRHRDYRFYYQARLEMIRDLPCHCGAWPGCGHRPCQRAHDIYTAADAALMHRLSDH